MRRVFMVLVLVVMTMITIVMIVPSMEAMALENRSLPLRCVAGAVIDQASMRVIYSKNGDRILPMASTTKIITAIVALENCKLDRRVVVSKRAACIGGSSVGLKNGESITLEELLYGLMLRSGNDAAIAIAEAVGGTVDKFVGMMNDKAIALGLYNTSFTSPHGLDQAEHYTTANELAKATAYALQNDFFAQIVATKSIQNGRYGAFHRNYSNINKFLFKREGADGVKTGFTGNAGKCLVASEKNDRGRYIAVIFNSNDRWRDAERLIDYAKVNYRQVRICRKGAIRKENPILNANKKTIFGNLAEDCFVPIRKDGSEKMEVQYFVPSKLLGPLEQNSIIGNLVISINQKIISFVPIYFGNKSISNE